MSLTNQQIVTFNDNNFETAVHEVKSRIQEKLSCGTVEHSVKAVLKTYKRLKRSVSRPKGNKQLNSFF